MARFLSGPRAALSFLTILPAGGRDAGQPASLGPAWFPLVGLLLGGIAAGAFCGVGAVTTRTLGAAAALAALALLTGALHLDGLADSADGLLGGVDRERRLEIMRDPRVGSFGVVAVVLVLIGDWAALSAMGPLQALAALLVAAAMGRFAVIALLVWLPYARREGLGVAARAGRLKPGLLIGGLAAALPLALDWRHGLLAAALVALVTLGLATLARARIGGATGDVYGAAVELGQLVALVAFAVRL
ncbi:MAG: adenosylcobinamide-GDP ribazoletransferase [Candidatus Dormibacteraeota bacterium]|nr:adenosylcobinamide-GDP ribazoletransferase [Candidatus Dormibacteraeota bacterium]